MLFDSAIFDSAFFAVAGGELSLIAGTAPTLASIVISPTPALVVYTLASAPAAVTLAAAASPTAGIFVQDNDPVPLEWSA